MKIEKQTGPECQFATIAMLAGVPIQTVRNFVKKQAGCLPSELYGRASKFYPAVKACYIHFKLGVKFYKEGTQVYHDAYGTKIPLGYVPKASDLKGKGQLIVIFNDRYSHAVAFENGMIFDPTRDTPIPWEEYSKNKRIIHYIVTQLTKKPDNALTKILGGCHEQ